MSYDLTVDVRPFKRKSNVKEKFTATPEQDAMAMYGKTKLCSGYRRLENIYRFV
jgi:hypothetical protein